MSTNNTTNTATAPTTWNEAVLRVLQARQHSASLSTIYGDVEAIAPELVAKNQFHWRDKVRQRLQVLGRRGLLVHPFKGYWGIKP
jgi:DNA-binding ferritin-like protein (Dps family)